MLHFTKNRGFIYFSSGLILAVLSACKSIQPTAPPIELAPPPPPAQSVSSIHIPVEMELKSYFKAADEAVPFQFKGREDHCEDVSFSYTFDRKPISIEGRGKKVKLGIEGKYALNLNYCAKCSDLFSDKPSCVTPRIYASCGVGEPMRRIEIEYQTAIDLKPDFKLDSKTTLEKLNPKDKCEITVFRYDATSQLVKEVKKALKELGGEIDRQIEALPIRKEATDIWKTFTTPFPLGGYGFLSLNPDKLGVNDLKLDGSKLNFDIAIEAHPRVSLNQPENKQNSLPNLSNIQADKGFNIQLELGASYDSLSAIMNRKLSGKVIPIKKQQIILQNFKVYGAAGSKLSFQVNFTGSKSGTMYFEGSPLFNDSLQEISFPDLSFDLETKNALLRSAKWLFNDKITNMIREQARYNMLDILKQAAQEIEKQMNGEISKGIWLKGKMDHLRVNKIYPDQNQLLIHSELKGNLKVTIK